MERMSIIADRLARWRRGSSLHPMISRIVLGVYCPLTGQLAEVAVFLAGRFAFNI
jgi:hypothetical protein